VLFVCIDFNAVYTHARVMWMGIISQHTISSSDKSPLGGCVCVLLVLGHRCCLMASHHIPVLVMQ